MNGEPTQDYRPDPYAVTFGALVDKIMDDFNGDAKAFLRDHKLTVTHDERPLIEVRNISGYVPLSEGAAMEYGLIPDTRPPTHYSRWTRLRWKLSGRWWALRRVVGFWVAGERPIDD